MWLESRAKLMGILKNRVNETRVSCKLKKLRKGKVYANLSNLARIWRHLKAKKESVRNVKSSCLN